MVDDHYERHAAYCRRHNYKFLGYTMASSAELTNPSPYWFKVDLILRFLRDPQYTHIFWLDTDAIVVDESVDLRTALPPHAWLGMTVHPYGDGVDVWHYQSGVMYIRSCPESLAFFEKVWGMTAVAGCEQTAMHQVFMQERELQQGMVILPYPWNNTLHDQPHNPIVAAFHGHGNAEQRREIMKKYVAAGCRQPIGHNALIDIEGARGQYEKALIDGDADKAIAILKIVCRDWPGEVNALRTLGSAYQQKGDGPGMISAFGRALALDPRDVQLHILIAQAYDGQKNDEMAAFHYNEAIRLDPNCARAHLHRAYFLMTRGWEAIAWGPLNTAPSPQFVSVSERLRNWNTGVADYEWSRCVAVPGMMRPVRSIKPAWNGNYLGPHSRLFVYHEQGLGDSLWMTRWLPEVKKRSGAVIILEAPPSLLALYDGIPGADMVVSMSPVDGFAVGCDEYISIMSLFAVLKAGPYMHQPLNYLTAEAEVIDKSDGDFVVGLCWKGSATHPNDGQRSIPFPAIEKMLMGTPPGSSLATLPETERGRDSERGITFVSLQHEDDTIPPMLQGDMHMTASRIAACDLVITVDSSVAHLAGAMGKAVWTLLPVNNDWRWFKSGETTPWYPSMRLYRQASTGDWASVLSRVADALIALGGCTDRPEDAQTISPTVS